MTSCIASACLLDKNFDADEVYYSMPRHGMDEESFNALFQHLLEIEGASADIGVAYGRYCNDVSYENGLREAVRRPRLVTCSEATMRGYVVLMAFWKHLAPGLAEFADPDAAIVQDAILHVCNMEERAVRSSGIGGRI